MPGAAGKVSRITLRVVQNSRQHMQKWICMQPKEASLTLHLKQNLNLSGLAQTRAMDVVSGPSKYCHGVEGSLQPHNLQGTTQIQHAQEIAALVTGLCLRSPSNQSCAGALTIQMVAANCPVLDFAIRGH